MSKPGVPLESFSTFGDLLKHLRRRVRLTQRELSIAVKYSEAQISRLEQNQRPPDLAALAALFVPALYIEDEPELVARFLELGAKARGEDLSQFGAMTFSGPVQHNLLENSRTVQETVRNNLPLPLTSFVGREREIADLKNLLQKARLVTLTGSGGCGKTRLAIEAAGQFAESYPDGTWLIELAPVLDPSLVPPTLTSTLGISTSHEPDPIKALTHYLRSKETLLILDNCEQILAGAAHIAKEILRTCPQVRILVTSREILNSNGEAQFRVPALSLPDKGSSTSTEALGSEAVRLFVERAQTVLPHFILTDQAASAVSEICQLVDGLPLGIELAAAKVSVLSVEQIAARLQESFRLLGKGRDTLLHHQTLEATIQWSYDLLSESERLFLVRLAIFSGGWILEAAETVTCDEDRLPRDNVLDLLSQLVNKSLVVVGWQMESEARYILLQTIHEFAHRKLCEAGDLKEMRARHFKYFFSVAGQARLFGNEKGQWLDRLEAEHDNLRAALNWSLEAGIPEQGAALVLSIVDFYWFRGFAVEAREWMEKFLAIDSPPSPLLALLLQKCGWLTRASGHFQKADLLLERALEMALEIGDKDRAAWALMDLSLSTREQGDKEKAISFSSQALSLAEESGDNRTIGVSLYNLAESHESVGDLDAARRFWEQGLSLFHVEGDQTHVAWGLEGLAGVAYLATSYADALDFHRESLQCKVDVMDKLGIAYSLDGLAQVAAAMGDPERAAILWGAANYLREALNVPLEPSRETIYTSRIPVTRSQMGDEAFDRAWQSGKAMSLQEAIAFALILPDKQS